ncbi:MAG: helix-turn-helix transcriptional regulator [Pseudomonadota bacterium]
MLAAETSPPPHDPQPERSVSTMLVTRLWHIMDLRNLTIEYVCDRTGIPADTLLRLHAGTEEMTVDQLARFLPILEVHWMAVFDGMLGHNHVVPPQLMDRNVAELAARLHKLPALKQRLLHAVTADGAANG